MRRIIVLSALVIAVALVLSAPMAEAKDNSNSNFNTIQCSNRSNGTDCIGTSSNDYLVGMDAFDHIEGRGGNDVYDGKGGGDELYDFSRSSSDYYYVSVQDFGLLYVYDAGGRKDTLDLSPNYSSSDFDFYRVDADKDGRKNDLLLAGPGHNANVVVFDFFGTDSIDSFKFSDKTLTTRQVKNIVTVASNSESTNALEQVSNSSASEHTPPDRTQENTSQEGTSQG